MMRTCSKIDASGETIMIQFVANPNVDPETIIHLIQSRRDARLAGPDRLRFTITTPDLGTRVARIREILKSLTTVTTP